MMDYQVTRLTANMDTTTFECGEPTLDTWLKKRALSNETLGASRTYVVLAGNVVVGYHALAAASLRHDQVTGRFRRNKPDPIPVLLLARLAVDRRYQGLGLAHHLFQDVVRRSFQVLEIAGVVAIMVHAVSPAARSFYLKLGFSESLTNPMTLFLLLKDAMQVLTD
ncbi:MAG TPA: GNAT family N-acetyltransferase [Gemmatales bacterium]|nr:GNAT family N-acetyltransferase [Gemmatales bacterium]